MARRQDLVRHDVGSLVADDFSYRCDGSGLLGVAPADTFEVDDEVDGRRDQLVGRLERESLGACTA